MIHLGIRQRVEQREESLSPCAMKSRLSRGRGRYEEPCPVRTAFQRDRDRIIHSKSFRRLKHKTQVFIAPLGDHYATRLTHTLEVSQIARTIARALNLNEDLVEAISLGHDLGHTPFGHVGEDVLNELYPEGFRHNEQSLRVVDYLERDGRGLNLTWEVREGILNHSKTGIGILSEGWGASGTLEGEVCKIADIVAYINHDTSDAIRADHITEEELPGSVIAILGRNHSERIDTLVCDIIDSSWVVVGQGGESKKEVAGQDGENKKTRITMSHRVLDAANDLYDFLFERVYNVCSVQEEAERARRVVRFLYRYFIENPERLPQEYALQSEGVERMAVDYIAGMTDWYALRLAREIDPAEFDERHLPSFRTV